MDYEKMYKEALERARKFYNELAACRTKQKVATIFPELTESEDERIREWLVNYFKAAGKSWIHRDISPEQILAYLEKQKEPENTSASTMAPSCWAEEHPKEQKPNIELIQRSWYMEGYNDRKFGNEPKWIIKTGEGGPKHELNPRYGQPLTERQVTEEQLHNLNEAIKSFRMDGFDRIADSLHSLYNILTTQAQKPAEWSGEDADILNCCISSIEEAKENRYAYKETDGNTSYDREIDWLKSLRPQYHGDVTMTEAYKMGLEAGKASSWKPSEEHLSALLAVFNDPNNIGSQTCQLALTDLYEQLKKL